MPKQPPKRLGDNTLKILVDHLIGLARALADLEKAFKKARKELIEQAKLRKDEHLDTDGGGKSWSTQSFDGSIARVTFPGKCMRGSIPAKSQDWEEILAIIGGACIPDVLFDVVSYKPRNDIREYFLGLNPRKAYLAAASQKADRLLALCTTKPSPQLAFEIKPNPEAQRS